MPRAVPKAQLLILVSLIARFRLYCESLTDHCHFTYHISTPGTGIAYQWVASRVAMTFRTGRSRRSGYGDIPIDEDVQTLRFES